MLVVANLSRFVQPVELDLAAFKGLVPMELFGRMEFPAITERPYFLTLGPHAFFWFSLEEKTASRADLSALPCPVGELPALTVEEDWEEVFEEKDLPELELALSCYLPPRRWFGGKAKALKGVHLEEIIPLSCGEHRAMLTFLRIDYVQSESDTYAMPLGFASGDEAKALQQDRPTLVIATVKVRQSGEEGVVFDALGSKAFCQAVLDLLMRRRNLKGKGGELEASHTHVLRQLREEGPPSLEPSISKAEQSNSSVIFGDRLILKFFRRLDLGVNPDLDISRFLTARHFPHVPGLAGALEYRRKDGETITLALLSAFVPQCKDAWEYTLDTLSRYYDRVLALPDERKEAPVVLGSLVTRAAGEIPAETLDMIGTYIPSARLLGERTAALHLVLASEKDDPEFTPEPFNPHYVRGLFQSLRNLTRQNFQLLSKRFKNVPEALRPDAQRVLSLEQKILDRFSALYQQRIAALRIRHHGDYHLGQVLYTGKDFLIIDFEGEPARSIGERRLKRSPLRDVAGMIRSFHYAAFAALFKHMERGTLATQNVPSVSSWARFWYEWVSTAFLQAYRQATSTASFLPPTDSGFQALLDAYLLEKAIYELGYELNNRPTWLRIPLQGILELVTEPA